MTAMQLSPLLLNHFEKLARQKLAEQQITPTFKNLRRLLESKDDEKYGEVQAATNVLALTRRLRRCTSVDEAIALSLSLASAMQGLRGDEWAEELARAKGSKAGREKGNQKRQANAREMDRRLAETYYQLRRQYPRQR